MPLDPILQLAKEQVEELFPGAKGTAFEITSEGNAEYNCIAWAAHDKERWWWSDDDPDVYWPEGLAREPVATLESFIQAYNTIGFSVCDNDDLEVGFEKICIYTDAKGVPTHAARQLEAGVWTSKLGRFNDIEHHTLEALSGTAYGIPRQFMKRRRT
jgi:hypothetical protein